MSDRHDQMQRLLSEAHDDPTSVDQAKLAAARKHARGCPRCRTFQAGLARIDAADRGAQAPARLADRIIAASKAPAPAVEPAPAAAVAAVAVPAAIASADDAPSVPDDLPRTTSASAIADGAQPADADHDANTEDDPAGVVTPIGGHRRRPAVRIPRLAWGLAAAAAVTALFIGVRFVTTSGVTGGSMALTASAPEATDAGGGATGSTEKSSANAESGNAASLAATKGAGSAPMAGAPPGGSATVTGPGERLYGPAPKAYPPGPGRAPASGYVASAISALPVPALLSFDGDVWGFSGWLLGTSPTLLVQVGTVRASLGSTHGPVPRAVYERVADRSVRYVAWSDSEYQVYRPLSRAIGGATYRMVAASPIRDWGVWPMWPPAAGAYPRSSAGLQRYGMDQYGTPAYTEPGIPATKGLALPPDVGGAAPNPVPKWTWWRLAR